MERKFTDRIIGVTGYTSLLCSLDQAIYRIIELEGGKAVGDCGYDENWEVEQLIIIGDQDFNEEYLIESIEVGIEHNFTCQYISMEDFWDLYADDFEPYFEGDPRIEQHAGLSFLASLGFKYPSVDIFNFSNKGNGRYNGWNTESILRSTFGYSVRSGMSVANRRKALKKAVSSPKIISLEEIAKHIKFLIDTRKSNETMSPAVGRWASDLKWLKRECYDNTIHSFVFPNVEV